MSSDTARSQSAAPPRGFPAAEHRERVSRLQARMEERRIDAVLITTEADLRYYTGFLTPFWQSPTRPWFLVIHALGAPIAVIPAIGETAMTRTWIEDVRCWSAPHPSDDGISLLVEALGGAARIGLAMDRETYVRMPLAHLERLRAALVAATFVDAGPALRAVRARKSEREIDKIRHVARLACDVFDDAHELFHVGLPVREAFRRFRIRALERGVDDVGYLVGGAGPGGYDDIISPPGDRPLAAGDLFMLDTGCVYDGYWCDFDRNFAFGAIDDAARRAYDTAWRATEAGLEAARPGATAADLFSAMNTVLVAGGALGNDVGRLGHGLGSELTEPPSNAPFDHTVLEPGMVMTLEPGLTFAPGRVMVHEENLVIRDDGPELLTRRAPAELLSLQ